ncbi:hypothetical protein [Fundidesulfovibrio putealis]|uniref:hypothetical protein n=1 Tax=Fundidesulfovibrio putealis TaxID=270496 RepID=UPI0003FE3A0D|nr:hypothetical protein [Fundidesulfovibrio putealis]
MSIDANELAAKIRSFYPEIAKHNLPMKVTQDPEKKAWVVELEKGDHKLKTYVEYPDAQGCLEGRECVHLSTQIGQFVKNYCGGACPA